MDENVKAAENIGVADGIGEEEQVYYLNVPESGSCQVLDLANILAREGFQIVEERNTQEAASKELQAHSLVTDGFVVDPDQTVPTDQSTAQSAHALLKLSESLTGAQMQAVDDVKVSDLFEVHRRTEENTAEQEQRPAEQSSMTYILDDNGTMIPFGQFRPAGTAGGYLEVEDTSVSTIAICTCWCGKEFFNQEDLNKHKKQHKKCKSSEANQVQCELCSKVFLSQAKLASHHRIAHPYGMPWECSVCNRRFSKKIGLKVHLRAHIGLKQHQCTFCDRAAQNFSVSDVIKYFKINPTEPAHVYCNICKKRLKYTSSSNFNLKRHLKTKHPCRCQPVIVPTPAKTNPDPKPVVKTLKSTTSKVIGKFSKAATILAKFKSLKPLSSFAKTRGSKSSSSIAKDKRIPKTLPQHTTAARERARLCPLSSTQKAELDRLLVEMIAKDMQTLSLVEDEGFKKFISGLDGRYEIPSRKHLTKELLPNVYLQEKQKVAGLLALASHVAVTTDFWTARTSQGYITLTAHFVTDDFKMTSFVLSTLRMMEDHTASKLASLLKSVFQTWIITEKVQAVVTDNTPNMPEAVKQELKLNIVPCFAQSLNVVVQESLRRTLVLDKIRTKVNKIVSYFHNNPRAANRLQETQKKYGTPKKLVQDEETRWNSAAAMLNRYIEHHNAVTEALCHMGRSDLCITESEVGVVNLTLEVLKSFQLVAEEMLREKTVTLSKMIPIVKLLEGKLACFKYPDFPLVSELQYQLRHRFASLEDSFIASAATVLDPRFKRLYFTDKIALQSTEEQLIQMLELAHQEKKRSKMAKQSGRAASESGCIPKKKKSIWDAHDEAVEKLQKKRPTQMAESEHEMNRYFECAAVQRDEDPLQWWLSHTKMLPHLSKLAQQFLGIPATSVPAERLFSKAGEMKFARTSLLEESWIDELLFLNSNIHTGT